MYVLYYVELCSEEVRFEEKKLQVIWPTPRRCLREEYSIRSKDFERLEHACYVKRAARRLHLLAVEQMRRKAVKGR